MDTVDDLFSPYPQIAPQWDAAQFPSFSSPPAASPDDSPDPATAIFPTDPTDPTQIPLDMSAVSAAFPNFSMSNPFSFITTNPSNTPQHSHLQNNTNNNNNPNPNSNQFPNPIHYSAPQNTIQPPQQPLPQSQPHHHPPQQRNPNRLHLRNIPHTQQHQQLSHHSSPQRQQTRQQQVSQPHPDTPHPPQPITQPSHTQSQAAHSSPRDPHSIHLHQQPPLQRHNSSQQHSQNSQVGVFQPPPRPHSNTMQSGDPQIPQSSQASHHQPIAIDSTQPQLSMHTPQPRRPLPNSQQQHHRQPQQHSVPQDLERQFQLQYQMHSSDPISTNHQQPSQQQQQQHLQQSHQQQRQGQKQQKGPQRRKISANQRQQNATSASQRRQQQAQQTQAKKRQLGTQRQIGKTKSTRVVKHMNSDRQSKQVQQQSQQRPQQHAQPDFGLLGASRHEEVQGRHNPPPPTQHQQQQTQQLDQQQQQDQQSHQHSQQNMFSAMTPPGSSIPGVSSTSIPTSTMATGTTITGTPSATNSAQRSPPETPHSSNRKTSVVSGPREAMSEVQSSMDKSTDRQLHRSIQTNGKHSQSSSRPDTLVTAPRSSSASVQHPGLGPGIARVTKPRDKQARLRKRLKCCTSEQLVELVIGFVRANTVAEKIVNDSVPPIDVSAYVLKCNDLRDAIYAQLTTEDPSSSPFDSEAHRRCKKALMTFKAKVTSMGKTLVDANLWADVIRYCVAAAEVNDRTPIWTETAHNKSRISLATKLEQFALRAATAIGKSKLDLFVSPNDRTQVIESCRKSFPTVATKLESIKRIAVAESGVDRMQNFDDPMISNTGLDLAM